MLDQTSNDLHSGEPPLLQTIGLTKRYGDFLANDSISIEIQPKQIHALLGENGAGKSTLVKAIYGLIQPSAGEIRWQGQPIVLSGPSEARSRGIGMVFQHFSLFDNLTVAENVALGLDGRESFKDISARLEQVSKTYGLPLDPRREVWQLSVGERQRIEIVRALMQDPKFLILDEPTAVLTPQEADQLFIVLERLKAEGRAILYISHKLDEVKRLCDTATILRGGKKVETCNPRLETAASLARMMVGGEIKEVRAPAGRKTTVPRLVVNDLSLAPSEAHGVRLEHISFELKGGEILGIAGVAGNGQDELFAALSGERMSNDPGTVVIEGIAAGHLSITQRRKLGAAFVPEERLGHGTAPRMKLSENALLTGHAASGMVHHGFIDTAATLKTVDRATETFDVRKAKRDPEAASLSGGNLQKFIVGREILRNPAVLVVSQPTWGVDAGAAAVNLGVEGMMIVGAACGFAGAWLTGSIFIGALFGIVAGTLMSLVFALMTLGLAVNQVATGLALTILGVGLSGLIGAGFVGERITPAMHLSIPGLTDMPLIGRVLFGEDAFVYFSIALVIGVWWFLYRTRAGLILRACGDNHVSAHALGYPVLRIRTFAVMFGGACAGLAGAYLPLAYTPFFIPGMTAGRGWIALALVVFSSWRPGRLVVGAYLFGAVTILQLHAQGWGVGIPSQFMSALPYLATVIVLVLLSRARTGGSTAPAALGTVFVPDR